jgi:hypothetical protein
MTNPKLTLVTSIRLVNVDCGWRGCGYLPRQFVKHNCNKLIGKLEIGGLKDMMGSIEDNERIARDVGLKAG